MSITKNKPLTIYLAQIKPRIADLSGNAKQITEAIQKALYNKIHLLVFPECALTGYPLRDLLLDSTLMHECHQWLYTKIIPMVKGDLHVLLGTPYAPHWHLKKTLYPLTNAALHLHKALIQNVIYKTHLVNHDVFDERRYFHASTRPFQTNNLIQIHHHKILVSICRDLWDGYPTEPLTPQHPRFLPSSLNDLPPLSFSVNLSASPFHYAKPQERIQVAAAFVQKTACPLYYVNQVGAFDELIFDGNSFVMQADQSLSHQLKSFETDSLILTHQPHPPATATSKASPHYPSPSSKKPLPSSPTPTPTENIEAIHQALLLGLRDYMQTCGFQKAAIGISGGVDSALTLCLAAEALGPKKLLALTMPSRFTPKSSLQDAMQLCKQLNVPFQKLNIEPVFKTCLQSISPLFASPPNDITHQNLQARIRTIFLMAFANQYDYLPLATGNKSELAMGYTTLYGDMSGSLCILGDLYKSDVYALAHHLNKHKQVIPLSILQKEPSAELKQHQQDRQTLPPYEVLDPILKQLIETTNPEQSKTNLWNLPYPKEQIQQVIQTYHKNEFKRYQAPPILKVSRKSFGCGRRFPIAKTIPQYQQELP